MLALATRVGTTRVDSYVDFASASVMTRSLFTRLKMEETERQEEGKLSSPALAMAVPGLQKVPLGFGGVVPLL